MPTRTIPPTPTLRATLRQQAHDFAAAKSLTPPVPIERLEALANEFIAAKGLDASLRDWLMVELHNGAWLPTVAAIPHERRLLLLPKCLRHSQRCQAEIDDLGLLCHGCGQCIIPSLQAMADRQGMLSLVAEGFTSVIELIRQHVVDAVIGVSCLDSLEKAFPLLISHAVPGLAVALNDDGCANTHVDTDYVAQLLPLHSDNAMPLLNYDTIRSHVDQWFTPQALATMLTPATDATTRAAHQWLLSGGSRWRPFLLAATYVALTTPPTVPDGFAARKDALTFPPEVVKAAVATECFHKASLVHDDIQDNDDLRYGKPTVHAQHGIPMAINIGDLLLGEGYRLLASLPDKRMLQAVAEAHVSLCLGQGAELEWEPGQKATIDQVLNIFRLKTVPAFEMALRLGLYAARVPDSQAIGEAIHRYSLALGTAYQLRDDLCDSDSEPSGKPSAVHALRQQQPQASLEDIKASLKAMADDYRTQALTALADIEVFELKRLLFQATDIILPK